MVGGDGRRAPGRHNHESCFNLTSTLFSIFLSEMSWLSQRGDPKDYMKIRTNNSFLVNAIDLAESVPNFVSSLLMFFVRSIRGDVKQIVPKTKRPFLWYFLLKEQLTQTARKSRQLWKRCWKDILFPSKVQVYL